MFTSKLICKFRSSRSILNRKTYRNLGWENHVMMTVQRTSPPLNQIRYKGDQKE